MKLSNKNLLLLTIVFWIVTLIAVVLFFVFKNMNNEVMNVLSEIQVEDCILGQNDVLIGKGRLYYNYAIIAKSIALVAGVISIVSTIYYMFKCRKEISK